AAPVPGPVPAQRSVRALLHYVAALARQDQLAGPGHARRLDEQDVAADRRPGEAGGDAGDAGALRDLRLEAGGSEDLRHVAGVDADAVGRPFRDPRGGVAKDRTDRPLQVANPGFPRVVGDDG